MAGLNNGEKYSFSAAARKAGKVSSLVRPVDQRSLEGSAIRGISMVRCFLASLGKKALANFDGQMLTMEVDHARCNNKRVYFEGIQFAL